MKRIKVSILALSVLVGGAVFASAADKTTVASTSDVTITNVAPLMWVDISDIPRSDFLNNTNSSFYPGMVYTDGKGKIEGVANIIKNWQVANGTNPPSIIAQSSWLVNVKGKVSASKMNQPKVQMNIKSMVGYTAPSTNVLIINGETAIAGASTLSLSFKADIPAVPKNTNDLNDAVIVGSYKGSCKTGISAVNNNKPIKIDEAAALDVYQYIEDTLPFRVVRFGNKIGVMLYGAGIAGTGNVKKDNKFSANLKGSEGSLKVDGQLAALTWIGGGATNTVTTISTASEKGKIAGQAVEGQGFWSRFGAFVLE